MSAVAEMAKRYYPKLWSLERLRMLVGNGQLSVDEYEQITGQEWSD